MTRCRSGTTSTSCPTEPERVIGGDTGAENHARYETNSLATLARNAEHRGPRRQTSITPTSHGGDCDDMSTPRKSLKYKA